MSSVHYPKVAALSGQSLATQRQTSTLSFKNGVFRKGSVPADIVRKDSTSNELVDKSDRSSVPAEVVRKGFTSNDPVEKSGKNTVPVEIFRKGPTSNEPVDKSDRNTVPADIVRKDSTSNEHVDESGRNSVPIEIPKRQEHTIAANKRRQSYPLAPVSRNSDVIVTSSHFKLSMAEVVARMRVREKTLLEGQLLKNRFSNKLDASRDVPRYKLSASNNWTTEETASKQGYRDASLSGSKWLSKQSPFFSSPKTRKIGIVAASDAWGTSRLPAVDDAEVPRFWGEPGILARNEAAHLATNQSTPAGVQETQAAEGDGQSDEDNYFDFDEDEVTTPGLDKVRQCHSTASLYQRACRNLRVQPLPAFLRQCNITTMGLRDFRLGASDVKPIAIALVRDVKLVVLDLSNNDLGPIGVGYIAEMLQQNSTLMDLNLSATNPGREGVKILSETLRHNRCLTHLRLEENRLEHTISHLLADMILNVPRLQGLYLGHNRLGYYGGVAIASAIAQNRTLLTLDLHWNHIRRDSAVLLIRALATNACLRTLNLAWNGLGKEGCLALAQTLPKNTSLRELDLTCNRIDYTSLGFLLHGLVRNRRLNVLKVGQNPLTTEGAKSLINGVMSARKGSELREIDVTGIPIDEDFIQLVLRAEESHELRVIHDEVVTKGTENRKRDHEGSDLDRYDPVMMLFEYMKIDNLRVIDMFQFMDTKKRDKLSRSDIRDGLGTLKIPVSEHAVDVILKKLDLNRNGYVELDEMMKMQRESARQVKLRQIKAKSKKKEDRGLTDLHRILRGIISKRTDDNAKTADSRRASISGLQQPANPSLPFLPVQLEAVQEKLLASHD